MKIKRLLFTVLACGAMALTGCGNNTSPTSSSDSNIVNDHVHKYEETWTYNDTHHWHACEGCIEKKDYAEHSWTSSKTVKEASKAEEGLILKTCECGFITTETIDKLEGFDACEVMRGLRIGDYVATGLSQDDIYELNEDFNIQISNTFNAEKGVEYGFRFDKTENKWEIEEYLVYLFSYTADSDQVVDYSSIEKIEMYSDKDLTKPLDVSFADVKSDSTIECSYLSKYLENGTYFLFVTFNKDINSVFALCSYVD